MKHAVVISLAAFLSACTVGPDFKAPDAPATERYTVETDLLTADQHVTMGKQVQAEWWTLFASPQLDEVMARAMKENYSITAAREAMAQAEEAVKAEQGGLLPQARLDASAGRQKYGVAMFGSSNFSIPPFTYYEAGPAFSWDLDLFGGKRRSVERQQAMAEYQAHELGAAYVELTANVVTQALAIAAAQAEIDATQRIIEEDEKTLKLVKAAFEIGTETRVSILTTQSQLDNAQAELPALRQRQSVARHALSILAGQAPADWTPPEFALSQFALPSELPVSLPSELVRRRPDIRAAEANLHAASAAVGVATANLYPNIRLSASTMQEALTPGDLFKSVSNAWSLAAGLTAPLFSGGTLSAEKRAAEHAYQQALAQYKQTILTAFGQVADALTALDHDAAAIAAQQQALDTAKASLALSRKSYEAGNTGVLQIQDAQRQLAQAQLGLSRAISQRYMDTAGLFVALGGSPVSSQTN
ncbi:efflux transporter outer membrane subunit [bacterium]|nr:efflux transporter outer membrane subunit [bacterium]